MALNGVHNSVEAGVDSIEHGNYIAEADIKTMAQKGIFYVPTIYVGEYVAQGRAAAGAKVWLEMIKIHEDTFRRALNAGVKIAFGTDVGGFDWGIDPAVEFPYMVKYGMTPMQAIRSATSSAAELLGMQNDVGSIAAGKYADLVAVKGDPVADIGILQKIDFVMKGGEVHKGADRRTPIKTNPATLELNLIGNDALDHSRHGMAGHTVRRGSLVPPCRLC